MPNAREELLAESRKAKTPKKEELVARSELRWFEGKPAKAEQGSVGLALSSAIVMFIQEDDIGEVERAESKGQFRVGIKPDADVVVSETRVVKIDGSSCSCDGSEIEFVPTRFVPNKVAGFEIEPDDSINSPGIPGVTDPCISARRQAFDNCMRWPGSYPTMCGAISAAAEVGCRNIRLGPS